MQQYEYIAMPAPARGEKVKGLKSGRERLAHGVSGLMNQMAAEGWEYQRSDTLPCEERKGFFSTVTNHYSLLIFRRALPAAQYAPMAAVSAAPPRIAAAAHGAGAPKIPEGPAHLADRQDAPLHEISSQLPAAAAQPSPAPQQSLAPVAATPGEPVPAPPQTAPVNEIAPPPASVQAPAQASVLRAEKSVAPGTGRRLFVGNGLGSTPRPATPKLGPADETRG